MEKSLVSFSIQLTCERRSLFQDMTWSFLSIISGPLILDKWPFFVHSEVTRGDSFDFKVLITMFSLQEQSFEQAYCWF